MQKISSKNTAQKKPAGLDVLIFNSFLMNHLKQKTNQTKSSALLSKKNKKGISKLIRQELQAKIKKIVESFGCKIYEIKTLKENEKQIIRITKKKKQKERKKHKKKQKKKVLQKNL